VVLLLASPGAVVVAVVKGTERTAMVAGLYAPPAHTSDRDVSSIRGACAEPFVSPTPWSAGSNPAVMNRRTLPFGLCMTPRHTGAGKLVSGGGVGLLSAAAAVAQNALQAWTDAVCVLERKKKLRTHNPLGNTFPTCRPRPSRYSVSVKWCVQNRTALVLCRPNAETEYVVSTVAAVLEASAAVQCALRALAGTRASEDALRTSRPVQASANQPACADEGDGDGGDDEEVSEGQTSNCHSLVPSALTSLVRLPRLSY